MELKEQIKLNKWSKDMIDCQNSGLTQLQWCELRGIKLKTFEYRCRRVRLAAEELMDTGDRETLQLPEETGSFASVPVSVMKEAQDNSLGMATMVIKFENATVEFSNGILPAHLKMVLEVLAHAE